MVRANNYIYNPKTVIDDLIYNYLTNARSFSEKTKQILITYEFEVDIHKRSKTSISKQTK